MLQGIIFYKKNHKHDSRPKYFNKDTDISASDPPKYILQRNKLKVDSSHFHDLYDSINTRDNIN